MHCLVGYQGGVMGGASADDLHEAIDGLGKGEGGIGLGCGVVGEGEGDGAEAAEQGAEQSAGVSVGDTVLLKQCAEEVENGGRNLGAVESGQGAAEIEPVTEGRGAVAERGDTGLRGVLAAEDMGGGGSAAAAFAVGEDVAVS
jgi:hypothetical protein